MKRYLSIILAALFLLTSVDALARPLLVGPRTLPATTITCNLSTINGTAFITNVKAGGVDFPLARFVGRKLTLTAGGKTLVGWGKAAGTGETLDSNLIVNGSVWTGASGATPPTGWAVKRPGVFTIFDSGDGAPYDVCLKLSVNATPDVVPAAEQTITIESGALYKSSCAGKIGTAVTPAYIQVGTTSGAFDYYLGTVAGVPWATYSGYFTATGTAGYYGLWAASGYLAGEYDLFDTAALTQVLTPSPTGLTIVSAQGGSTYDWTSDDGIDPNAASYTLTVTAQ